MEYQLATYTPLNKTAKKKKIKRKPAAELEPIPVHCLLLIFIPLCFQFGFSISGGSIILLSQLSFVCAVQLSEYELDREQRVKRNHILMGDLVRATFFDSSLLVLLTVCGLFREFQSWSSNSIQSNPRLSKADATRMKQQRLITRIGGGDIISTLIIS